MIKGIFKLRPSLPKYVTTNHPYITLRYIDSLPHDKFLLLELLTKKLLTLLCLLSEERLQCLQASTLSKSNLSNVAYTFYIDKVLKTTKLENTRSPWNIQNLTATRNFVSLN